MKDYKVVWEIDVEATSPECAAIAARECWHPDTTALIFKVVDAETGCAVEIDLFNKTSSIPEAITMRFQEPQVKCLGCDALISADIKKGLCNVCQSIADKYNELIQSAGYTVKYNGTCGNWYALLPGETEFKDTYYGNVDDLCMEGLHETNYLGFFSTHWDLLKEVGAEVISNTMGYHNLSDEFWDSLSHEQHLVLVREVK